MPVTGPYGIPTPYSSESESHSIVSDSLQPHGLYSPWDSPGQITGVGSLSLLQGIFPTQKLNWGLLHCRQNLYQLSYVLLTEKAEEREEYSRAEVLTESSEGLTTASG